MIFFHLNYSHTTDLNINKPHLSWAQSVEAANCNAIVIGNDSVPANLYLI